jgi:hypothetical protein
MSSMGESAAAHFSIRESGIREPQKAAASQETILSAPIP